MYKNRKVSAKARIELKVIQQKVIGKKHTKEGEVRKNEQKRLIVIEEAV